MSTIKAEILFNGSGLDTDSSFEFTIQGDSPYRKNILVGEDGSNGTLTQFQGAHKGSVSYPLTLSSVYQVVGSYYNRLTRKCYYWVFSLPFDSDLSGTYIYDNKLLCYNEDLGTIDCIFTDTANYFGLHFNNFMKDPAMIGDWLFFNPKVSEPKMVDVERAYNYENYDAWQGAPITYEYGDKVTYYGGLWLCAVATNAGESPVTHTAKWDRIGDAYQDETLLDFSSEFRYAFNVLKMSPVVRPVIAYGSDVDFSANMVRGLMFRFSYRFKYFDNSYSVYSAFSDIALPVDDEKWNGEILDDVSSNNRIEVTISLHSPAIVKETEIIFQQIGHDWKRCKTVNRIEQAELTSNNFTYNFYNNESYPVVDSTEVNKIEDAVPRTARTQEIINKNILTYGGCKEGFTKVAKDEINVSLTPVIDPIEIIYDEETLRADLLLSGDLTTESVWDGMEWSYYTILDISDYVAWGVVANDVFRIVVEGTEGHVTLDAGDVASTTTLITAISDAIRGNFIWVDISHSASGFLYIGKNNGYPVVTVCKFYEPAGGTTTITKYRGFKTGAHHPFCQFYYDENLRRFEAHTSKENLHGAGLEILGTTVYVPMFNEVSSPPIDINNRWVIDWEVDHLPPAGAKYWRWGYAGNTLCSWFVQYVIEAITNPGDDTTSIDITPLQTLKTATAGRNAYPNSIIDPYIWEKGDRIRFITQAGDDDPFTVGDVIENVHDYEIIKQDDTTNTIFTQEFNFGASSIEKFSLVEIYRPLKSDQSTVFYEFGALLPVIEDSSGTLVHGGIDQDQDTALTLPATGRFDNGDVYHIARTPSLPLNVLNNTVGIFHESMWWSDFYDSDDWDKGKQGTETNFGERNLNIVRFSNQYLQNTQINGLSTFEGINYKELNDVYGDIMAMMEIGNTLKVYQERKPSSILIGRQEYTDTDGNLTVASSDRVLGSIRYSTTNWGTEFPESLSRNNRYVYGYDILNGVIWRDSANGIFPISGRYSEAGESSDYKMATYFKEKSKTLMLSGLANVKVLSVWDEEYKLLYVAFHDLINEENNDVVVFHEPSNRWITFAELESVEHDGYNQFLELTYDIITGFEGGVGFDFDDETRFAIFTIVTTAGAVGYFDTIGLTLTVFDPTVLVDSIPSQDLNNLLLSPLAVDVHISSLSMSETALYWDADEYGSGETQTAVVSSTEASVTVTATVAWGTVTKDQIHPLIVGSTVEDGDTLYFYPNSANGGADRFNYFTIEDAFGNEASVLMYQYEPVTPPEVIVLIDPLETQGMTISSGIGTGSDSSITVNITFTPDHPDYNLGDTILFLYWRAIRNSVEIGDNRVSAILDEQSNNRTISLDLPLVNGDTCYIYIGSEIY